MTGSQNASVWREVRNWWPLLTALFSLGILLGGIYYRLGNLERNSEQMLTDIKLWRDQIEARLGAHSTEITTLKTNQNIVLNKLGLNK